MYPNFNEEKKLWRQGYECVIGLDEAGRGPLAGPVVACAVVVPACRQAGDKILSNLLKLKVQDSKKLSERRRDFFYKKLTNHSEIAWGVGVVSEKVIDKINILEATKLAMQKAIDGLDKRYRSSHGRENYGTFKNIDFLLLDGNFTLELNEAAFAQKGFGVPKQKPIIRGDQKVFSIAAASIIAKVTRDRIMQKMHKKYPQYGFAQHKGYGTDLHVKNLQEFGITKIHRKSFWPVANIAKNGII